jgi:tetratricopeptide (TPR) repeat protein
MEKENEPQDPFEEARRLYDNHKYSDAVGAYRKALKAFEPNGAEIVKADTMVRRKDGYRGLADSLSSAWRYQAAFDNYLKVKESLEILQAPEDSGHAAVKVAGRDGKIEQPDLKTELAEVYRGLADSLDSLGRYPEAKNYYLETQKFYEEQGSKARDEYARLNDEQIDARQETRDKIDEAEENYIDRCNDLGLTYLNLGQYDKAIELFQVAIKRGKEYPYSHHNLAVVFRIQGRYAEAMDRWRQADWLYRKEADTATKKQWMGHFQYFGNMLHEVFGDFDEAANAYEEGLKLYGGEDELNEDHIGILISQVALYLEKMEDDPKERNANNLAARKAYGQAKRLLGDILENTRPFPEVETLLTMGELALTMNENDDAEKFLKEAYSINEKITDPATKSARPATDLGVLCMRRKEFKKAINNFEIAVKVEPFELSIISNLAEAYLKDGQLEEAEQQFHRALDIAPCHVESRIGLAGVYAALGEAGDSDMYDAAIDDYSQAITVAKTNTGSKRLKNKELAAVLYSRGYASVKSCEAAKGQDRGRLYPARADFNECLRLDPEQYKAKRAVEKINKALPRRSAQGLLEKYAPLLILSFSVLVFLLSQGGFIWSLNGARRLTVNEYIVLTFGSLVLMVASSYLPQLLKLKVPGIELEKTVVDQITTMGTVGISNLSQ